MSTNRNPVGPQPPEVYRRRRLMVGLGLLAVIIVIILIVVRPGAGNEGEPSAGPSASPSASPESEDAAGDETPDDGMCNTDTVTIEAVTDKDAYAAGELPQVSMRLTNVGASACLLDVTPTSQVYEVGSANEPYWLSSDCQAEAEPLTVTLEPNVAQSTTPIGWDRTRSLPCEGSDQQVPAADATYYLQVRLGELESAQKTFRLL
jgi:hypothetical protein